MFRDINSNRIDTVSSNDSLGVTESMSLDQKLSMIMDKVSSNATKVAEGPTSEYVSTDVLLSSVAADRASQFKSFEKSPHPYMEYTIAKGIFDVEVSWDLTEFVSTLPTGQGVQRIRVLVDGEKRIEVDSDKKKATFKVKISEFPAVLTASVRVTTKGGTVSYDGSIELQAADREGTLKLETSSLPTSGDPVELDELLLQLINRVTELESEVNRLKTVS